MSENRMKAEDILTPGQLAGRLQVGANWVYEKSRGRGQHNSMQLPVLRCGVIFGSTGRTFANGCAVEPTREQ